MKKLTITLGIVLFYVTTINAQESIKSLNFLEGHWKVENREAYEEWKILSNYYLIGESYKIKSGIRKTSEYLEIKSIENNIIYIATVLKQNDGNGIEFKLKKMNNDTFSFENTKHDFPKKIVYKKLNDTEIFVKVLGSDDKGYSYKMKKHMKPKTIPNWFVESLELNVGRWVADNTEYKSTSEPYTGYGLEWKWGIGQTSIEGRLYGLIDGKEIADLWTLRQYWDNVNQRAVYEQFGYNGVIGIGSNTLIKKSLMQTIQTFSLPNGRKWEEKHLIKLGGKEVISTSFNKDENNKWVQKRFYSWKKKIVYNNDLGNFSISLTVKDINTSFVFYEKLGFRKIDGGLDQKWLIMENGNSKVGLFQGMFPKNTITFNPNDVRKIYKDKIKGKIDTQMKIGLDKEKGKASFMITDPDGNPILIDQLN